jgi:hypothetical protein
MATQNHPSRYERHPSVFIGSSSEGLEFARAVRSLLAQDAEVTLWNEDFFGLGSTFIETLINALPRFDFAVLVLTPDDLVNSREVEVFSPRDNVIFELGLFMGRLGRSRTFILHQADAELKIPTDLSGMTTATYQWPRRDKSYKSAVGAACDSIRAAIRDLGVSDRKASKQINDIHTRQETAEARITEAETKIDRLFANTMSNSMFANLKKLATGKFGRFTNNGGLRRELRHLRDIGYVTIKGHIGDLPAEGGNLSDFVTATPVGKQFIELRKTLEKMDSPGNE